MARIEPSHPSKGSGDTTGPAPKISRELRTNADKASPMRSRITDNKDHAKISGFTKGSANKAEDKKVTTAWKRQIGA